MQFPNRTPLDFILFMTQLSKWGVFFLPSLLCAGISILAGIGFAMNESRTPYPLFDMALLKIRLFLFPVIRAALFVIVFLMPFYLPYPCWFPASKIGFIMIVPFLFLLVISPVSGILYDQFGSRLLCLIGMSILMLSLVSLLTVQPSMGVFALLWRLGLAGIGTALYVSPNNTVIMNSIPSYWRGIASGAVATARNIGMIMGVALAGLIFSATFSALTHGSGLENYTAAMEPSFLTSFRRAMMTGIILSTMGIGVTLVRATESK